MKVGVVEHFDSMHLLPGHKKCGVPHGHTYRVEVAVEGPVVNGMVVDFDILKKNLRELLKAFDHVDLNAIFDFPSCENISAEIHKRLKQAIPNQRMTIRIWEGEGKWAETEG
jgi:6-pyruvoyltetrahydropterin/6-carboxytetrahydropterin synthase